MKIQDLKIDGIDLDDYPDFCDAYASYAEWEDGTPLTDEELAEIDSSIIHDRIAWQLNEY